MIKITFKLHNLKIFFKLYNLNIFFFLKSIYNTERHNDDRKR